MSITRLCFVLPSLKVGGMERVMVELCNYIASKSSIEIHLVLLGRNENFFHLSEKIHVYEPSFLVKNKLLYTLKIAVYLRKLIREINPYCILSFGEMYNSFVLFSSLLLPVRVYVSDRSKPDKDWGLLHNSLRKLLYPRAFGIIAQTSYSKSFLQKEVGCSNIVVLPNPVRKKSEIHTSSERQTVILTVGRLIKSKRIDILLNIFENVQEEGWKLWIVGDGPERLHLEEVAREKGLTDLVTFWGSQSEIDRFYQQASIFAFTSESEGFPNALLEAISSGLPCISFDCVAGPRDLINHAQSGFLVDMYDEEKYIQYLRELIQEEHLRKKLGQQALAQAEKYDISVIGEAYLNVLIS